MGTTVHACLQHRVFPPPLHMQTTNRHGHRLSDMNTDSPLRTTPTATSQTFPSTKLDYLYNRYAQMCVHACVQAYTLQVRECIWCSL